MRRLFVVSPLKRFIFFLLADILIICASLYVSLVTHFEFDPAVEYWRLVQELGLFFLLFKLSALAIFRVYKMTWKYVGISDLTSIFLAMLIAELALTVASMPSSLFRASSLTGISKRVFFVDGLVSFCLIAALRVSKRIYLEVIRDKRPVARGQNTLIIGAGNTGEMMLRDLIRTGFRDFSPVGFLDDNPNKAGTRIHGVEVLGAMGELDTVIAKHRIEAIIVAIPRLNHQTLRRLYEGAKKADVKTVKIVPRIYDFSRPDINMKSLESIKIEDLVGRESISVDYKGIGEFIRGKSVLITGAGGSIGSEIVIQICSFAPAQAILFDIDETELHNLGLRLRRVFPQMMERIAYVTGDVRDELRLRELFDVWQPQIVFHAAAYKHVPMMEYNPKEAVKVNMFGAFNLAKAAREHNVEKFIMISTDKAVRPTSVMGATKRMAEFICSAFNEKSTGKLAAIPERRSSRPTGGGHSTKFMSVRFGNVLGSRGSVLPMFLDQLKYGGPLTVTHPDMKRYFMTIPEAVSLVLQASILGNGGEVFVLDMGKPAKIVDIAEELIRIHGMEPYKDIDIQFTGKRPGEKLFEEILTAEEGTEASRHEKIFVARNGVKYPLEALSDILGEFADVISDPSPDSDDRMKLLLKKYVKYYQVPDEVVDRSEVAEAVRN